MAAVELLKASDEILDRVEVCAIADEPVYPELRAWLGFFADLVGFHRPLPQETPGIHAWTLDLQAHILPPSPIDDKAWEKQQRKALR
jgi:hypothetical protein